MHHVDAPSDFDPQQEMRNVVARRVIDVRRRRDLTVERAAELGGVSHVTWRRIERAQTVKPRTYVAVDHFLELPTGTTGLMVERGQLPPVDDASLREMWDGDDISEMQGGWEGEREEHVLKLVLEDIARERESLVPGAISSFTLDGRLVATRTILDVVVLGVLGNGGHSKRAMYEIMLELLNRLDTDELAGARFLVDVAKATREQESEWKLPLGSVSFRPDEGDYRKSDNPWLGKFGFSIYTNMNIEKDSTGRD